MYVSIVPFLTTVNVKPHQQIPFWLWLNIRLQHINWFTRYINSIRILHVEPDLSTSMWPTTWAYVQSVGALDVESWFLQSQCTQYSNTCSYSNSRRYSINFASCCDIVLPLKRANILLLIYLLGSQYTIQGPDRLWPATIIRSKSHVKRGTMEMVDNTRPIITPSLYAITVAVSCCLTSNISPIVVPVTILARFQSSTREMWPVLLQNIDPSYNGTLSTPKREQ